MQIEEDQANAQLLGEGLEWVEALISGQAQESDKRELDEWRARSPDHALALRQAMRVLRSTEQIAQQDAAPAQVGVVPLVRPDASAAFRPSRRAVLGGGALAAGLAGVMVLRPPAGLWPSFAELMADARTQPGERRSITLAQGVTADLNSRTSMSTSHNGRTLRLQLITGEAVVDNRSRGDVIVEAGAGIVGIAAGANIAVRKDPGSVCVTCLAGTAWAEQQGKRIDLIARQQLISSASDLGRPQAVDLEVAMAWRRGLLVFRRAPLAAVVEELNRYRAGKIILTSDALAQREVFATFRIDRTDAAVAQVEQLTGARAMHLPGGIVLLS